ncbi:Putative prophage lcu4 related protein [Latilactobacillus curvatus]|uniref:hypothetical protein n=1 Tax=Latilactobacillus curvatus TaxID=28038 RepID=UPI000A1B34B2|nr:hypothetical protein [Latilactobacillus curvatus]SMH68993.1 Putative prophage lcu4 related protein [Latilactobacillus curvatus]
MNFKGLRLPSALKALDNKINEHIGASGDAHGIANNYKSGFMSNTQHQNYAQMWVNRKRITGDILTLPPGLYYSANTTNNPINPSGITTDVCYIDVTKNTSVTEYFVTAAYNGHRWHRIIYADGSNNMPGWARIVQEVVLWQGGSTLQTAVKLSEAIAIPSTKYDHYVIEGTWQGHEFREKIGPDSEIFLSAAAYTGHLVEMLDIRIQMTGGANSTARVTNVASNAFVLDYVNKTVVPPNNESVNMPNFTKIVGVI